MANKFARSDENESYDEVAIRIIEHSPFELESRLNALDKHLIIESASPGWQPRMWPSPKAYPFGLPPGYEEGGIRFPAIPVSIEDQANEVIKAAQAGCAAAHVHPRDPKDSLMTEDLTVLAEIFDKVFSETDVITIQHTWKRLPDGKADFITDMQEMLDLGKGNKYCQASLVLWPPGDSYPKEYFKTVHKAVDYMLENGVTPINKFRGAYHVRQMKRALVDTGILNIEPLVLVHDMGHPFGWPMVMEPWMPIDLISNITQTKERFPGNTVIGVFVGGRNWLPIAITAILAGVDIIRVGIEDTYWMYPHKDEVIQRNIDCVQKIVDFCKIIGRRIATTEEARKIMGIKRTS